MMRLAAVVLVGVLVAIPLAVGPAAPVTWLAILALVVGGAGVSVLSMSIVTTGASLTLIAYAVALVHFARRAHGAALGPAVVATQVRQWLVIVALGVAAAVGLTAGGVVLGSTLRGATLPVIVVAAALGAVMTTAGVIALVTARRDLPATTGR